MNVKMKSIVILTPFSFQIIKHQQHGNALLKTVILIPILFIVSALAYFGFCETRKAYWDYQVKVMCEKDGGGIIYEAENVNSTQLQEWGAVNGLFGVPHESDVNTIIPLFRRTKDENIHTGNPQVTRLETMFIRRSDGKLLAKSVYYFRMGGDFPTWAHDSSFGCKKSSVPIEKSIFVLQGAVK